MYLNPWEPCDLVVEILLRVVEVRLLVVVVNLGLVVVKYRLVVVDNFLVVVAGLLVVVVTFRVVARLIVNVEGGFFVVEDTGLAKGVVEVTAFVEEVEGLETSSSQSVDVEEGDEEGLDAPSTVVVSAAVSSNATIEAEEEEGSMGASMVELCEEASAKVVSPNKIASGEVSAELELAVGVVVITSSVEEELERMGSSVVVLVELASVLSGVVVISGTNSVEVDVEEVSGIGVGVVVVVLVVVDLDCVLNPRGYSVVLFVGGRVVTEQQNDWRSYFFSCPYDNPPPPPFPFPFCATAG